MEETIYVVEAKKPSGSYKNWHAEEGEALEDAQQLSNHGYLVVCVWKADYEECSRELIKEIVAQSTLG